ncbi:MAG: hypothetical protein CMI60_01425 [Parvibaculum sp.]|nr:hypothetical protein [Parvibaculum sp.]
MTALSAAQKAIRSVGKDAKNDFAKYDYVSAETMISECRRALHKAGLVFSRTAWEMKTTDFGVTVVSKYVLNHPESGEQICMSSEMVVPPAQKQLDKATLAALTTSLNYMLRDMLLIPRADEPEVDNMPEPVSAPKPTAKKKPAPKVDSSGSNALQAALALVIGGKANPTDYEAALFRHASAQYDREFRSVEQLPDEYVKRVVEAHDVKIEAATADDRALFGDKD